MPILWWTFSLKCKLIPAGVKTSLTLSTSTPSAKASSWRPKSANTSSGTRWRLTTTAPSAPTNCCSGWWETCWTSANEGERNGEGSVMLWSFYWSPGTLCRAHAALSCMLWLSLGSPMRNPTSCWETLWTSTSPSTQTTCSTCCCRPASTSTWVSGQKRFRNAKILRFTLSSKWPIVWIYAVVFCISSSVVGPRHPAAHSGLGPLPAWSSGLPRTAYSGAHSAQKTSRRTWGEAAERSGTLGGPVFSWPHHEAQEVGGALCIRADLLTVNTSNLVCVPTFISVPSGLDITVWSTAGTRNAPWIRSGSPPWGLTCFPMGPTSLSTTF